MIGEAVLSRHANTDHACVQPVSCMFVIGAYTQTFIISLVVQPILTIDVVRLAFLGLKARPIERQRIHLVEVMSNRECTEIGMEFILFTAVKIDLEFLQIR